MGVVWCGGGSSVRGHSLGAHKEHRNAQSSGAHAVICYVSVVLLRAAAVSRVCVLLRTATL
jgi:hypothetical protein